MSVNLQHIQVGEELAVRYRNSLSPVSHRLLIVDRLTALHVVCRDANGQAGEWRFLKATGKQVGEDFRYAEIATPELVASIKEQSLLGKRRREAMAVVNSINTQSINMLSVPQLEALAKAWQDIKAMDPAFAQGTGQQQSATCGHPI